MSHVVAEAEAATEAFEGIDAEAIAFILDVEAGKAEGSSEILQISQRRYLIGRKTLMIVRNRIGNLCRKSGDIGKLTRVVTVDHLNGFVHFYHLIDLLKNYFKRFLMISAKM